MVLVAGAHDDDGLLGQSIEYHLGEPSVARGVFLQVCSYLTLSGFLQRLRCRIAGEQIRNGRVVQMRVQRPAPRRGGLG